MRARLVLLSGQTICLGLMTAFLVVPASSLFLDEYGAGSLAYVYLAVAVTGVAASWTLARAQRRWSLFRLAVTVLIAYAVIVALAWLALVVADATWVTFPLLVVFPLWIPLGFVLVGAQAGRLLDLQQMKAHFPRVVVGFPLGFAIGGLVAAWLVALVGDIQNLFVLDVGVAVAFVLIVVETGRRYLPGCATDPRARRARWARAPPPTAVPSGAAAWCAWCLRTRCSRPP